MSSQKKIDANRANARKSTGPRTAAGKAASRSNAYRHGMRARTVIMPHEDQDQYHKLYNSYCKEFPSTTPHEQYRPHPEEPWSTVVQDAVEVVEQHHGQFLKGSSRCQLKRKCSHISTHRR